MANILIAKKAKIYNDGYIYQTLEGHTSDVLTVGTRLLEQIGGIHHSRSINPDVLSRTCLTVLAFHDYGKHIKEFQDAIRLDETASGRNKRKISHAVYSALWIDSNLGDELADWVCGLSMLSHHSSLHKSLFSGQITIPYKIIGKHITEGAIILSVTNEPLSYSFLTPWLALNEKNYEKYQRLGSWGKRKELLEKILIGNIISMSKSLGYTVPAPIEARIQHLKEVKTSLKGTPMLGFLGNFSVNFEIPDYWGIGKSVSRGFGTVKRVNSDR